jgi:hypothetical protein
MNRIDFLKQFFNTGLLLTAPRLVNAATEHVVAKEYDEVVIYSAYIAGFGFYKGLELLPNMKKGDTLDLVREPKNRYDVNAIAVYWQCQKIGFMPRVDNLILAAILDAKLPCDAFIADIHLDANVWTQLEFSIGLLYPKGFLAEENETNEAIV